jgi:sugar lactone lactonase YvrE
MSVRQRLCPWKREPRRAAVLLGGLLLALTAGRPAHAVTYVTVDGHPVPVTFTAGENITVHFDVSKPGGVAGVGVFRDLTGTGKWDASLPLADNSTVADGGVGDTDPAPGKVAYLLRIDRGYAAGSYILHVQDNSDNSGVDLPGVTVAPKPEAQAISGRVAVLSDTNPTGSPPRDAVIWAAADRQTLVASASIRPDGSYTLPVPPGTYILFAEWFGNLRSQRQVVNLIAGQQVANLDLPLLQGQEVSGTVKADTGQPMADAVVQVTASNGRTIAARTFPDGSFTVILPDGQYALSARGLSATVLVAGGPVDGVEFPLAAPAPVPGPGTIVTVAGNGIPGLGGDGGRAAAARLDTLYGVAVDAGDNLYLVDNVISRIRRVDATGRITTVAGIGTYDGIRGLTPIVLGSGFGGDGGPATAAMLQRPQDVVADREGNLYVADGRNQRVRKIDRAGIITTVAGSGPIGFGKGSFSGDGGPASAATLNSVGALALDAAGNLYIGDRSNARVRRVNREGTITTVAGGGTAAPTDGAAATQVALRDPIGVAVDAAGNLYIADIGLNRIVKVSPPGVVSLVAGTGASGFAGDGGPATQAQLARIRRLTVDRAGNLFFSDADNYRIRKISPEGIITTVAGSGPVAPEPGSYAGDGGSATAARLWGPFGVAVDSAGNLLLVDQVNRRIRKVIGIAAPGLVGGR